MKSYTHTIILVLYIFINFPLLTLSILENQRSPQIILPARDTFAREQYPNDNFGDEDWLWISNDVGEVGLCETFMYFELPSGYINYDIIYVE